MSITFIKFVFKHICFYFLYRINRMNQIEDEVAELLRNDDNIEAMSGGSIAGRTVFYILYILYGEIYAIASSVSNENDSLSFEQYQSYRSQHPGPLSERSFNKWKRNGGMDEPSFKWRAHPYRGVGRHRRKNSNQKVVNVFYQ
ncbi:uncharacterized protein LOC105849594 isoform X2 [Hydra vulgaris]|uniref:uncharacterized protein LOC105849594 isoform X2 n=1 Tax=Hydra vulgaris TaxID=6087 RepID=UPI001F5F65D9|nr:uncharacterized protein LOC105849594 isoform X3 [Hydra vulgaris]